MNSLQDEQAKLTRHLADISERRARLMEVFGPILRDREHRKEIDRKLRTHEKPMLAHWAATLKLFMVREELAQPPAEQPAVMTEQVANMAQYAADRRRILIAEEERLCQQLREMEPTKLRVADLQAKRAGLLPEDEHLHDMVESVQQEYNITQEELRRVEAAIAGQEGGAS